MQSEESWTTKVAKRGSQGPDRAGITGNDLKAMAAAAKASKQSLSEWIRNTIHGTLQ